MATQQEVRTNPSIFNSRRYALIKLRKLIESIINLYISKSEYKKLLDYGCGSMPYKKLFSPHLEEYIGADISDKNDEKVVSLTQDGLIPVESGTIDIVLSTQVLEHVSNPNFYLAEARRVLQAEGILIISTHGHWMYHPDPTDFWRWTSQGLKKILIDNGFEVLFFKGILGRSAAGLQLFQDGFIFKLPPVIKQIFVFIMQICIFIFDAMTKQQTRDKDASIYIVVAKQKKNN